MINHHSSIREAVYGQIAGCAYGYNNIPVFLLEGLFQREEIELLAREFVGLIEGKRS